MCFEPTTTERGPTPAGRRRVSSSYVVHVMKCDSGMRVEEEVEGGEGRKRTLWGGGSSGSSIGGGGEMEMGHEKQPLVESCSAIATVSSSSS